MHIGSFTIVNPNFSNFDKSVYAFVCLRLTFQLFKYMSQHDFIVCYSGI